MRQSRRSALTPWICLVAAAGVLLCVAAVHADTPTTRPDVSSLTLDKVHPEYKAPESGDIETDNLPEQAAELLAEARQLDAQRRSVLAIVKLEKALTYAPRSRELHRMLGQVHLNSGNAAKAELHLTRALDLGENDQEAWYWRGKAQGDLGRDKDALKSLLTAIRCKAVAGSSPVALLLPYTLGSRLAREGYETAALGLLQQVLDGTEPAKMSADQKADPTLFNLSGGGRGKLAAEVARLKIATGQSADALEILNALPESLRNDRSAQLTLLLARVRQNKIDEAANLLARIAESVKPDDADDFVADAAKTFDKPAQLADLFNRALPQKPEAKSASLGLMAAYALDRADRRDDARALLRKQIAGKWTNDSVLYVQLADWDLQAKDWDAAAQTVIAGVLSGLERKNLEQAVLDRVDKLVEAVSPEQAGKLADSLKTDFPVESQSYVRGRMQARAGQTDEALASLAKACELRATFEAAYVARMSLLRSAGREDDALAVTTEAVKNGVHSATLHHMSGLIQMKRGQSAEAINHLRRAEQLDRENVQIVLDLADAYAADNQEMAALRRLRRVYETDDRNVEALIRLARMNWSLQQWDEARFYAARLLKLQPDNAEAGALLGLALIRDGRVVDGMRTLRELAEKHPKSARAQLALAEAIMTLREVARRDPMLARQLRSEIAPQQAIAALEKALTIEPDLLRARKMLAQLLLEERRYDEALVHYRVLAEKAPGDEEVASNYVRLLLVRGDIEQAAAVLAAAKFSNQQTRLALALELAEAAARRHKPAAVLTMIDALIADEELSESRLRLQLAKVELLSAAERHDDAIKLAEGLHQAQPDSGQVSLAYLEALRSAKRFEAAIKLLDVLIATQPKEDLSDPHSRWQFLRILVLQEADRKDAAVAAAEAYHRAAPDETYRLRIYVSMLLWAERDDAAVKLLAAATAAKPTDQEIGRLYFSTLMQADRFDEAAALAKARIAAATGDDASAREDWQWRLIDALVKAGHKDEAVASADAWHKAEPKSDMHAILWLETLRRTQRYDDLIKAVDEVEKTVDDPMRLMAFRVEALVRTNKLADADQAVRKWVDAQPAEERADTWYQVSHVYSLARLAKQSREALEQALKLEPGHVSACNDLGYQLADAGIELDRAEKLVRHAVSDQPDQAAYVDSLGWVLYKKAHFAEAAEVLAEALRLNGGPGEVISDHYGDALFRTGDRKKALEHWRNSLKAWDERGDEPIGLDNATRENTAAKVQAVEKDKSDVPVAPIGEGIVPPGAQRL